MKMSGISVIQESVQEAAKGIADIRSTIAALMTIASKDKKPTLQLVYMQANALHQGENFSSTPPCSISLCSCARIAGEQFDVTCFSGVSQYHCLRAHGECTPGHISSCHLRATDFESMCQAEPGDPQERATFVKNTRKLFLPCLVYSAATHLSWQMEENHESISTYSRCFLQATRKDLRSLAELEVDPVAQIVTVIIDVITDKGATHFVKAGSGSVDESKDDEDEDDEDKDDNVGDEDKDKDVSALLHSLHNSHSLHSTHSLHSLHSTRTARTARTSRLTHSTH